MIKALLLIIDPKSVWGQIAAAQRPWRAILAICLLPFLALVSLVEGYGLVCWGRPLGNVEAVLKWSLAQASLFELGQTALALVAVFLGARLIKSLGETFCERYSTTQTLTVAAYGLSPLFLLRIFDAFPAVSPWATWAVGIVLSAVVIYHGLPRIMQPEAPHAFGLYVMSVLPLVIITGLECFLTTWYLEGGFARLNLMP